MSTNALIIGGRGGIGGALTALWKSSGRFDEVLTSSRQPPRSHDEFQLDLADENSIQAAAAGIRAHLNDGTLSHIAICSGVLHSADIAPERRLAQLAPESFQTIMAVNALGPMLIAKHFVPLLAKNTPSQLTAISARVGSISDNRLGGWYSYRCAKAALNQGLQSLAIELRRSHPQCVVTLFHPGTVDSALSEPFQKNVPPEKLFSPERAAQQMDALLQTRSDPKAHIFFDWAGEAISF